MKSIRHLIILVAAIAGASQTAHAQHFSNCEVVEIVLGPEPYNAHVQLSCLPAALPPCAVGIPFVAFDRATVAGRQFLALFVMAHSTGAKVSGYIDASCPSFQPNVALLSQLRVSR